jgi:hypothetical protein
MANPSTEPSWKRLFSEGGFAWSFRMRPGDVRGFFNCQDDGGSLLTEKRRSLQEHPSRYVAATPAAQPLVDQVFDMAVSWGQIAPESPRGLIHLAHALEPDILLMDSMTMTLVAGCVCMPSSWDLAHAIGKPMHVVHDVVPRLNAQIGDKIGQFLSKIPEGKAFLRENWSLTRTADRNYHPALHRDRLDASAAPEDVFLRIEHQIFTAIPGGILMGLRIETCPLADLAADSDVWHNLTEIIRTMPDDVACYKSMLAARDPLAERMARYGGPG